MLNDVMPDFMQEHIEEHEIAEGRARPLYDGLRAARDPLDNRSGA